MTADAVGGVWVYATELARGLCARGDRVTLVVMGPPPRAEQLQSLHGIRRLTVKCTGVALEWMDPEGLDVERARECLLRIAERSAPDIIHLNGYREATFGWQAPILVAAHSCVWSWWRACRGGNPDAARWHQYARNVAAGLSAADAWVAPTAAFRDAIEDLYPTRTRGHVIRNGVDLPDLALPKESFVLAAGRTWDEAKNLTALDAIAPRLDWPVRVAGSTRAPDESSEPRSLGRSECFGPLSRAHTITLMRQAAIFVAPALYEPFGLSILEAAACGCALVLSDIPTLRELWDGAALFTEPRDGRALAATLQQLCSDRVLRAEMQQAARQRARRYSLTHMVNAYRDLYDMVERALTAASARHARTSSRSTKELSA
jgi:glycosyltransferase involved in cell wall biosynthesis